VGEVKGIKIYLALVAVMKTKRLGRRSLLSCWNLFRLIFIEKMYTTM
jgi:hypothetical protein